MEAQFLAFDPQACGTAADWNAQAAYLTLNKRSAAQFIPGEEPLAIKDRLEPFLTFLSLRSDSQWRALDSLLVSPQQHDFQWFRFQWLPSGADAIAAVFEEEGWVRAWHTGQKRRLSTRSVSLDPEIRSVISDARLIVAFERVNI